MPTTYIERLVLPKTPNKPIVFTSLHGLEIATNYERVVFGFPTNKLSYKKPFVEFKKSQINFENLEMPHNQKWRVENDKSPFIEYRSKDFTNLKVMHWKITANGFKENMFYVSAFDLTSKEFPVLIELLKKRKKI